MASKLKMLQEQKDRISREIEEARNEAQPEIETAIHKFFQKLKEDFGLYNIIGDVDVSFAFDASDGDCLFDVSIDTEKT